MISTVRSISLLGRGAFGPDGNLSAVPFHKTVNLEELP